MPNAIFISILDSDCKSTKDIHLIRQTVRPSMQGCCVGCVGHAPKYVAADLLTLDLTQLIIKRASSRKRLILSTKPLSTYQSFKHSSLIIHHNHIKTMKSATTATVLCLATASVQSFSFVQPSSYRSVVIPQNTQHNTQSKATTRSSSSQLSMVDSQVLMGGGIAVAGLVAGIGMLTFAESMGERAKERGGGLSENMSTRITGGLMEDTEVDAVSDLSSLTEKLEAALKETGGAKEEDLTMSEEDKKRIAEEADDGW